MIKIYSKLLLLIMLFLYSCSSSFSYELILPKERKNVVTSNYALFVGKANSSEVINIDEQWVYTTSNGAFAHSVKLKEGENRIPIRSGYKTQVFYFNKITPKSNADNALYELQRKPMVVKDDNTPLRSTPVDAGLNRIAHLFKGTTVLVDGTKGKFYRVFLSKDKYAWIDKSDLETTDGANSDIGHFINMDSERYKNATVQNISFSKNLPYTVEERGDEIIFRVYNPEYSESSVYTINIPKPAKYYYRVTLENGKYVFKVSQLPTKLEDITVAIDAGHGGSEKGAIGCLGDKEKDINLKIAQEIQKLLKEKGINVVMTRECDGNMSLDDRVKFAKDNGVDIFISIHLNSIGDIPFSLYKHRGTSVFYFNPNSKRLAEILERKVSHNANTRKDGVKGASFAVIRPTDYVGVLIENAYMINPFDSVLYTLEDFPKNVAQGVYEGIVEFVLE